MFDNFDFSLIICGSGVLDVYADEYDSVRVLFANECVVDACWNPRSGYCISLERDHSTSPIAIYTCHTKEDFSSLLQEAIDKMEIESKKPPYYGPLWKTEYRSL